MAKQGEAVPEAGSEAVVEDGSAGVGGEHADVAAMTYEQARDELVGLVARLENGQVGLEESMSLWQRGEVLATHCSQWLDRAEARISADD
jgi:exodeoxyribonuclease VII small subunit